MNRRAITHGSISQSLAIAVLIACLVGWVLASEPPVASGQNPQPTGVPTRQSSKPTGNSLLYLPVIYRNYSPPIPSLFGAQFYDAFNSPAAAVPLAQEAHVYWARWPVSWASIEPTDTTPDQYRFTDVDAAVLAAHQAGIHLVVNVVDNPIWAATYKNGVIDKVPFSKFAEFMGALAERYDGDGISDAPGSPVVDYWELYNEPDAGDPLNAEYGASYWGPFGAQYAQMLCAVYPAIKSANSRAKVALGGLAYDSFDDQGGGFTRRFLDDVLTNGGGACFDAMNFHYYPPFAPNWAPYGPGLSGKANYIRSKLQSYGWGSKPMIVTEAGWHSENYWIYPSTPEIQSQYVVKFFTQSLASRLDLTIWWTWRDPGGGAGPNGLITQSLQRKPAFTAFKVGAEKLNWAQASFQRSLTTAELGNTNLEGYVFTMLATQKPLYVLWSNDGVNRAVTLSGSQVRVVDMYGGVSGIVNGTGTIRVTVGSNPVYVETIR
jgi:hypothetical protein